MTRVRVLLVDDHEIVRRGLRRMLELEESVEVVGDCANAQEAFSLFETFSPDVVLMDIKMPGTDGIRATRLLKEKQPACKIIMLTLYGEYITEAIEAGAEGYLLKDVKRDELVRAIRTVQQDRAPFSPWSRESLAELAALIRDAERSYLSERESAILRLVASGATTREIAHELLFSEATIRRDVKRILEKLGVRNRPEAAAEAYKRRLI